MDVSPTDNRHAGLYTRRVRAISIVLLIWLTVACQTPYQPTPLPPSPTPTPTPTPSPSPPPSSLQPFELSLYPTPTPVEKGKAVNLVVVAVGTAPREPFTVTFSFGDGSPAVSTEKNQVRHTYASVGKVTAAATLVDAAGRRASTETLIDVRDEPAPEPAPPQPPPPAPSYIVTASASPTSVIIGDPTTVTATAIPQNGAPAPTSYAWDCTNDGTIDQTTAGPSAQCSYTSAGTKTVLVTARSAGATGSGTTTVTVTSGAQLFVGVTASNQNPAIGDPVTFTATVTSSGPIPPSFQWFWDDTNDGNVDTFETGASPKNRTTSYGSVGAVTMKVRAVDPITGREATGTKTVTVQ